MRFAADGAVSSGLAAELRATEDAVRRLTDSIAWAAKFRPDREATTPRDVNALQILAEWAVAGVLVRDAIQKEDPRFLGAPFMGREDDDSSLG